MKLWSGTTCRNNSLSSGKTQKLYKNHTCALNQQDSALLGLICHDVLQSISAIREIGGNTPDFHSNTARSSLVVSHSQSLRRECSSLGAPILRIPFWKLRTLSELLPRVFVEIQLKCVSFKLGTLSQIVASFWLTDFRDRDWGKFPRLVTYVTKPKSSFHRRARKAAGSSNYFVVLGSFNQESGFMMKLMFRLVWEMCQQPLVNIHSAFILSESIDRQHSNSSSQPNFPNVTRERDSMVYKSRLPLPQNTLIINSSRIVCITRMHILCTQPKSARVHKQCNNDSTIA